MSGYTKVTTKCPMCGNTTAIDVPEKGYNLWQAGELIQRALPTLNPFEREALINGMCFDCQSKLYHRPKPGDTSWGNYKGECDCCGAPIWDCDKTGDTYRCKSCGSVLSEDELHE